MSCYAFGVRCVLAILAVVAATGCHGATADAAADAPVAVPDLASAFDIELVSSASDANDVEAPPDASAAADVEPLQDAGAEAADVEPLQDVTAPIDVAPPPCAPGTLRGAAACSGRHVGAAVAATALATDPLYAQVLGDEFDMVTPEGVMKWAAIQPAKDSWSFGEADALVNFAAMHGQVVKGHTLLWHQQVPKWVGESMTPKDLSDAVHDHITTLVSRYAGQVEAWDVVNEALADDGTLRPSLFLTTLGSAYIADAFVWAHAADPVARLIYNDYGTAGLGPKSDGLYALVASLLAGGVPIDEVGFQMHLDGSVPPSTSDFAENMARFTALGVTVNVSEMDVRVAALSGDLAARLAVQARVYRRILSACVAEPLCTSVSFWGFSDKYTWIDGFFGPDDPLLFDDALQKKPAWFAAVDALQGLPPPPVGQNLVTNPGFEDGATGWNAWGCTLATSPYAPHAGTASGLVTDRTAVWQGPVHSLLGLVQPGHLYRIAAFVRVSGATAAAAKLTFHVVDDDGEHWKATAPFVVSDSAWTQLHGYISPFVAGTATATDVYVEGPDPGVAVYVDDVEVREY